MAEITFVCSHLVGRRNPDSRRQFGWGAGWVLFGRDFRRGFKVVSTADCSGITSTITTPWIASKIKLNRLQLFKASAPVILTVVASSLILINPNWLIISLLGSGFSESAGLVYGLFVGSVFSGLSVIWGSWAQAIGKSRPIATISAVQVCIQFGIGSLAIVNLGIYAYVAVAALSQIFAAISSIVVYSRANSKN